MGIRMSTTNEDAGVGAFSRDILKIEINGSDVSPTAFLPFHDLADNSK
jgi:hypothetical protein